MSRTLGASLLAGTIALLAACSGTTPTSARIIDNQGPRRVCSGYLILTGDQLVPTCVECTDDECTPPDES